MKQFFFLAALFISYSGISQDDLIIDEMEYEEVEEEVREEPVFMVVEKMPVFKGCENEPESEQGRCTERSISQHLINHIKYPPLAMENGHQGKVFVEFVVNKKGEVEGVRVLKGVHEILDKEAVRVIQSMPAFQPGTQRGKAVKVKYTIPVKFSLS